MADKPAAGGKQPGRDALRASKRDSADSEPVYFDNNATTAMPPEVINAIVNWMNRGDPSAEHAAGRGPRKLLQRFRQQLAADGAFELEGPRGYTILFTSGASESNSHVVTAAARAFSARTGKLPHIVTSAVEHDSLLACCRELVRDKIAQLAVIPVRTCEAPPSARVQVEIGAVDPGELQKALRPNTCLVSIVAANGETGTINDLRTLGACAHALRIPFHTDAAQLFGRSVFRPSELNLDAFSVSFHKLHGPPGVGFLALRNDFIEGYGLGALVSGAQNGGLRGGAENIPGIAGAFAAYKRAAEGRSDKNRRVRGLRDSLQAALSQHFLAVHLGEYCGARPRVPDGNPLTPRSSRVPGAPKTKKDERLARRLVEAADADKPVLVWIGPLDSTKALPNTLCFSVLRPRGFCAGKARAALEKAGFVVSSAPARPSHIVEALDVPPELWRGVLRVSLSDHSTAEEISAFVNAFAAVAVSSGVII